MKTIRYPSESLDIAGPSVVAIGVFDGVHRGHVALLEEAKDRARKNDAQLAVVTFDPHPAEIVRADSAPLLLTTLDQRLDRLAACGVDIAVVIEFDKERSKQSADDFVKEVAVTGLNAVSIVVGFDFHFGAGRSGNVETLTALGRELNFDVLGLKLEASDEQAISSTRIREYIREGELQKANELLGHPHATRGVVVHGDHRGRELGFPTANLEVRDNVLLPAYGVYAGRYIRPNGEIWPSAISVGTRPTFHEDDDPIIEAHLLDFDGDLYGENAVVEFVVRLRGQEKFESAEQLIQQMTRDCETAAAALK